MKSPTEKEVLYCVVFGSEVEVIKETGGGEMGMNAVICCGHGKGGTAAGETWIWSLCVKLQGLDLAERMASTSCQWDRMYDGSGI